MLSTLVGHDTNMTRGDTMQTRLSRDEVHQVALDLIQTKCIFAFCCVGFFCNACCIILQHFFATFFATFSYNFFCRRKLFASCCITLFSLIFGILGKILFFSIPCLFDFIIFSRAIRRVQTPGLVYGLGFEPSSSCLSFLLS